MAQCLLLEVVGKLPTFLPVHYQFLSLCSDYFPAIALFPDHFLWLEVVEKIPPSLPNPSISKALSPDLFPYEFAWLKVVRKTAPHWSAYLISRRYRVSGAIFVACSRREVASFPSNYDGVTFLSHVFTFFLLYPCFCPFPCYFPY